MLEASVAFECHPRTVISLAIHVAHNEGSLLAACINCATLCLLDASVALKGIVVAAACSLPRPSASLVSVLLLDPISREEQASAANCCVATLVRQGPLEQAAEGAAGSIVFMTAEGSLDSLESLTARCVDACATVRQVMLAAVAEKLSRLGLVAVE